MIDVKISIALMLASMVIGLVGGTHIKRDPKKEVQFGAEILVPDGCKEFDRMRIEKFKDYAQLTTYLGDRVQCAQHIEVKEY